MKKIKVISHFLSFSLLLSVFSSCSDLCSDVWSEKQFQLYKNSELYKDYSDLSLVLSCGQTTYNYDDNEITILLSLSEKIHESDVVGYGTLNYFDYYLDYYLEEINCDNIDSSDIEAVSVDSNGLTDQISILVYPDYDQDYITVSLPAYSVHDDDLCLVNKSEASITIPYRE